MNIKGTVKKLLASRYIKNFTSRVGLRVILQLASFITLPIVSRALGPEKYGEFNFANTILVYAMLFANFGFGQHMLLKISQQDKDKQILSKIISLQLYISLIVFLISILIVFFFLGQSADQNLIIFIILLNVLITPFDFGFYFIAKERMVLPSIAEGISVIFKIIATVFLVKEPRDLIWVALIIPMSLFIKNIITFVFFKDPYYKLQIVKPDFSLFPHLKESAKFGFAYLFDSASKNLSALLIGLFISKELLGYYTGAGKIIEILMFVFITLVTTFMPLVFRTSKIINNETIRKHNVLFYSFLLIGIFGGLSIFAVSGPAVSILFGNKFENSIWIVRLWSISVVFYPLFMLIGNVIIGNKGSKQYMYLTMLISFVTTISTFAFLYFLGFKGAVYSQFVVNVSYFLISAVFLFYVKIYAHRDLLFIINPKNYISGIRHILRNNANY